SFPTRRSSDLVDDGLDQGGFDGHGGSPPVPPVSRPGIARTATRDDAAVPADTLVPRACHAPVAPAATDQVRCPQLARIASAGRPPLPSFCLASASSVAVA